MNRTIKFRGKRIDNGEWIFGYYLKCIFNQTDDTIIFFENSNVLQINVFPETVGQFVGLCDGKEIYKGDVVYYHSGFKDDAGYYIVDIFDNGIGFPRFGIQQNGGWHFDFPRKQIEVIGNIHDNPELLK